MPDQDIEDWVDLHTHTSCSDGTLSPSELVGLASTLGLRAVAITDHDTVAGNPEALAAGERHGIEVLPGVEISTQWEGVTFHLLGYGLRQGGSEVEATFAFLEDCRRQRNPLMIAKLRELGVSITLEEVAEEAGGSLVGRPHFARVLLRKGAVASLQEAFDRFLGRGAAAYVDKTRLPPSDACKVIRDAGGVPVLAHPGLVEREHRDRLEPLIRHLIPLGLAGVEAYYSSHTPEQTAYYLQLCRRLNLVATGGSDFHQPEEAGPRLGTGFGNLRVPYSCLSALKGRLGRP